MSYACIDVAWDFYGKLFNTGVMLVCVALKVSISCIAWLNQSNAYKWLLKEVHVAVVTFKIIVVIFIALLLRVICDLCTRQYFCGYSARFS